VELTNNTIANNKLKGIYCMGGSVTITNCIVWDNGDDLSGSGCGATYSCIKDPCDAGGTGNITDDPCFVNYYDFKDETTAGGTTTTIAVADASLYDPCDFIEYDNNGVARTVTDSNTTTDIVTFTPALGAASASGVRVYNWGSNTDVTEDYHLAWDWPTGESPCINSGDPCGTYTGQLDIDGDERILGGRVDMGADEARRVHNLTQDKWYWYINEAIDDASGGDEIVAYKDEYEENVDFDGKAITVRSSDPEDPCTVAKTIIYANGDTVAFDSGEGSGSVLSGFTITGGSGNGIYCLMTSPVIKNNNIWYNGSRGIYAKTQYSASTTSPTIENNKIYENSSYGIYVYRTAPGAKASPTIRNNEIYDNSSYGVYIYTTGSSGSTCSPTIENNKIYGNSTYGIRCHNSITTTSRLTPTIKNNWIYENGGTGIRTFRGQAQVLNNTIYGHTSKGIYRVSSGSTTVTNCIVWDNVDDLSGCSATYSCISNCGDVGDPNVTHNICVDPNFFDAESDDYHLTVESPCINAGDPCYVPEEGETDIDGEGRMVGPQVDMGGDEFSRVHNITQEKYYYNIQDAIDEANSGDEIVAYPGRYYENVDFDGKAITVRSTDPEDPCVVTATIINANGVGKVVSFDVDNGPDATFKGFTITRGGGHGIYCYESDPLISKCIIEDNGSYGVYCKNSRLDIKQCAITDNGSHGICIRQDDRDYCIPTIEKNKIYDNRGLGIYGSGYISSRLRPSIKNNWIYENDSFGIYIYNGTATVYNNTIAGNTSYGICHLSSGSTTVKNCIVWENGNDIYGSNCIPTYSCIQDLDGGAGNIHTDPNFVDDTNGDYQLTHGSGCIDAANGNVDPPTDIFGEVRIDDPNTPNTGIGDPNYVDMGACEYNPNKQYL
jgi:hypothetical protein